MNSFISESLVNWRDVTPAVCERLPTINRMTVTFHFTIGMVILFQFQESRGMPIFIFILPEEGLCVHLIYTGMDEASRKEVT
jgi:hypothetical protein